ALSWYQTEYVGDIQTRDVPTFLSGLTVPLTLFEDGKIDLKNVKDVTLDFSGSESGAVLLRYIQLAPAGPHWAEKQMKKWRDKGVVKGYEDGSLRPDNPITRAETAKIMCWFLPQDFDAQPANFEDVSKEDWFYGYVNQIVGIGMMQGMGDTAFAPNANLTREMAATIIYRQFGKGELPIPGTVFSDSGEISAWAQAAANDLAANGIIAGYPDGSFKPKSNVTRAEFITMLDRLEESANAEPTPELSEEQWLDVSDATFFNESNSQDTLQVGSAADGADPFAFLCPEISATWLADEVTDARLFLKVVGTAAPERLRVGIVTGGWDDYFTTDDEAKALVDEKSVATVDVTQEDNGWVSLPLTDIVKKWLSGGLQNNGAAIFGETSGEGFEFISMYDENGGVPYVKVSGAVGDRPLTYGKFGYTEQPVPDAGNEGGNCMSYALRDTNPILDYDLKADKSEMARIYTEAGESAGTDALADYFTRLVKEYVEDRKAGLQISRFRQIENFDSKIDTSKEYRIAMRVGVDLIDGPVNFSDPHSFDYHFWAQLNDGRWAQKFPPVSSMIVPCTGPGISPGAYPWDSAYQRTNKTRDYYTSKTVYFAVTKDTNEFTMHRGETVERPIR
ncbi:MAG: S-layer homology domain-containing protein, partial [Clostridiales bacterium]|nr:S-layer homology domain-containing protein [Clostridiales bacterium]